jgi:LysR family transcriptional regulator, benzoate and cis,cis-muconate-responsive activator of ben and cat genes
MYLEDARLILQHVNEATIRAGRVARELAGTLRVGFTESASWHGVVPDSFRQFRQGQPAAELQLSPLSSLEQVQAVRSGRLDSGFVFNMPKTDPELDQIQVALQKLVLAVPKGHPVTKSKSLRLSDLTDADFV